MSDKYLIGWIIICLALMSILANLIHILIISFKQILTLIRKLSLKICKKTIKNHPAEEFSYLESRVFSSSICLPENSLNQSSQNFVSERKRNSNSASASLSNTEVKFRRGNDNSIEFEINASMRLEGTFELGENPL